MKCRTVSPPIGFFSTGARGWLLIMSMEQINIDSFQFIKRGKWDEMEAAGQVKKGVASKGCLGSTLHAALVLALQSLWN